MYYSDFIINYFKNSFQHLEIPLLLLLNTNTTKIIPVNSENRIKITESADSYFFIYLSLPLEIINLIKQLIFGTPTPFYLLRCMPLHFQTLALLYLVNTALNYAVLPLSLPAFVIKSNAVPEIRSDDQKSRIGVFDDWAIESDNHML